MRRRPGRLITIGSFDGVHRGHAALLDRTVREAGQRGLKSLALTFEVPPRMILRQQDRVSILSTSAEKERLLKAHGIDEVVFLDFTKDFSNLKPHRFFQQILLHRFKAKGLVVGLDFRFGAGRTGGAVDLVRWGQEERIPVWVAPQVKVRGRVVSSTEIRSLLLSHRYRKAVGLLNHPYLIEGRVVRGRKVGRRLGFPTTNLKTSPGKVLPNGIFIVRGWVEKRKDQKCLLGVCNIGRRPTFFKDSSVVVEPHWLEGKLPRLGESVMLELLHHLREEKAFHTAARLQSAIRADVTRTRAYFLRHPQFASKTPGK